MFVYIIYRTAAENYNIQYVSLIASRSGSVGIMADLRIGRPSYRGSIPSRVIDLLLLKAFVSALVSTLRPTQ
jgi:hypothetical protein